MKLAIAILIASLLALGGIASASTETESVAVSGTIEEYLDFSVTESTGVDLSPAVTPSNELVTVYPTGDYIDTDGDWVITLSIPVNKMTAGTRTLQNPLVVSYGATEYNGIKTDYAVASGGPTGTRDPNHNWFTTSYKQQYSATDYAGAYGTTVTWVATSTF